MTASPREPAAGLPARIRPTAAHRDREVFPARQRTRHLVSLVRLIVYACAVLPLLLVQTLALTFWPALARRVPGVHHRMAARVLGMRIVCDGEATPSPGTLFVSNHVSYLDIIVLGAVLQARFVAKSAVSGWPFFGLLARLSGTLFIERRAAGSRGEIDLLRRNLEAGERLIVFPEGTSGDGTHIMPFKSTLFAAVEDADTLIQPVSICFARLNGIPIGRALRPLFAWYGAMELLPHLWAAAGCGRLDVRVVFHDPVRASDFANRKTLARHCRARVAAGVHAGVRPPS